MIEFIEEKTDSANEKFDLMRIYTTSNSVQAHLICQRLIDEGIHANVVGDFIEQGQPLPSCIEILVPKCEAATAQKFLDGWKVRTEQTTSTQPFSVWTTAAFLFTSVALIAYISVDRPAGSQWIDWTLLTLVVGTTGYWLKNQFASEAKIA